MNNNKKQYTLDDGTITNAHEVAAKVGITISNARSRLSTHSSPDKVWKKKQNKNVLDPDSYKMRRINSRGMGDAMLVLAMKKI